MPQVLIVVGAILVVLGALGVAAGAPDWLLGLSLGATLIQSGTIALVGGLVLIGLALVLDAVQDLLDRLDAVFAAQAARRPAIEQKKRPIATDPAAAHARTSANETRRPGDEPADLLDDAVFRGRRDPSSGYRIEESARAARDRAPESAEPLRSSREDPPAFSDDQAPGRREAPAHSDETIPRIRREAAGGVGDPPRLRPVSPSTRREETPRPRRPSLLPLPPPPLPLPPDARPRPRDVLPDSPAPRFRPVEVKSSDQSEPETTVVRSGVIGGMAYTLYADGSIEAELPIGTVRFGSISDLQDHVTRTGTEADVDFKESSR
jgi:hypothetical protein